jgi:hypothetical protein
MSLGAVFSTQKQTFYIIALFLNFLLAIGGVWGLYNTLTSSTISAQEKSLISTVVIFLLIITPIINLIYIRTKMLVLMRKNAQL